MGIQGNKVPGTRPEEAFAGEEILDLKGFVRTDFQILQRHMHKRRLGVMRIDGDGAENQVVLGRGRLAVKEDVVVFRVMKANIVVLVKRAVFLADGVELGDVLLDVSRRIPVAPLKWYFSESRYSSLPGTGVLSQSSNPL